MANIEELTGRIIAFRNARNWKQFHNPKDLSLSLLLEAAELVEHFQWKTNDEMSKHVVEKKEEIAEELADIFYYVLLTAHDLGIDPITALEQKMEKNEAKYPVEKSKDNHKKYTEL